MKAISPVIATVIIVSVAIAISIAVALWLTGITSGFTGLEKLEIVSGYATKEADGNFTIHLTIRNTGTGAATIQEIFINGVPHDSVTGWISITPADAIGHTIPAGESYDITIKLDGDNFHSGQTVEVKIHTAAGKDYPKSITLP